MCTVDKNDTHFNGNRVLFTMNAIKVGDAQEFLKLKIPQSTKVLVMCSVCGVESTRNAYSVKLNLRRNGKYICNPCKVKGSEAFRLAMEKQSERKRLNAMPSTYDVTCGCGATSTIGSASRSKYLRRDPSWTVKDWRCLRCISTDTATRLNYRKEVKAIHQRFPVKCGCGKESTVSYNKWYTKLKKGVNQWRCLSCASKFAFASGANKGTTGMKFVDVQINDINRRMVNAKCDRCGNTRSVTIDAVRRQLSLDYDHIIRLWDESVSNGHVSTPVCHACAATLVGADLRLTQEDFLIRARAAHGGRYNYSRTVYTKSDVPTIMICKQHGEFKQRPCNHYLGSGCPECAYVITKPTREIGEFVESLGFEVKYNDRTAIKPKEIDVWVPSAGIGVEYHGLMWHRHGMLGKRYHQYKRESADRNGVRLTQVFEDEWRDQRDVVCSKISDLLGVLPRINLAEVIATETSWTDSDQFMSVNSVFGASKRDVAISLIHRDTVIYSATFYLDNGWILTGFTPRIGTSGAGCLSRIIEHFMDKYNVTNMTAYADLRWCDNAELEEAGFNFVKKSEPTYQLFEIKEKLHKRQNLIMKCAQARSLGLERIYDAGRAEYLFTAH